MSKEQMMQEFVSSAITPLLERVVVKKLIQSFDVIAEQQKAELTSAKARIAELERVTEEATSILCGHNFKGNSPLELMARKAMGRIAELEKQADILTDLNRDATKAAEIYYRRNVELEKALEPFANAYHQLCKLSPDGFGHASDDLRRAADLLKEPSNG